MKRTLILVLFLLASCTTVKWTMGMSEADFKSQSHQIKIVEMSASRNVYSFQTYDNGIMYFYFSDGKLFQIDHGQRRTDIVIQSQ